VFGKVVDDEIPSFIPRYVDALIFEDEKEQWKKWHSEQTESEDFFQA
jgi:hypothetical protein